MSEFKLEVGQTVWVAPPDYVPFKVIEEVKVLKVGRVWVNYGYPDRPIGRFRKADFEAAGEAAVGNYSGSLSGRVYATKPEGA